jgi:hypothetical protein
MTHGSVNLHSLQFSYILTLIHFGRELAACGRRLEVISARRWDTVENRKSQALRAAIVGKIAAHPTDAIKRARRNLHTMQQADSEGHATRVLDRWAQLLDGPIEGIVGVMLSSSRPIRPQSEDDVDHEQLASSNPFAGLLSAKERWEVLRSFRSEENSHVA